ncbi:putative membrane protein (TIGR02234 family) [Prauserella sediminis]|uniref:Putative membrane protein (TIGR02234 family) n=1 Tax=Prauserella sediminis TaxID=577680 RepID=A0A839XSY7_9PSEU|nr:Trp biosynthesis-associated membrane protein [Prauserella sediminis]MBB3665831.1 putative membrane protein (TIGR02234 family) [Prauserella sediminis]
MSDHEGGPHGAEEAPAAGGGAAGPAGQDKRSLWAVVVVLLLGSGALWGASGLVWLEVPQGRTVDGRLADDFTGGELVQWPVPIALLALAAVAATLALRGAARRALGVLLAVVGAWTVYLALAGDTRDIAWSGWAPGYEGRTAEPVWTFWGPAAAVAGGACLALAGAVLVWRGHRMARMGAKYSAPGDRGAATDPELELWDALSGGDDPTDSAAASGDPAASGHATGPDAAAGPGNEIEPGGPPGADRPRDGHPE